MARPRIHKPTARQRHRVMIGVAAGLTLPQLALDANMPEGTLRRVFAVEIRTARVRVTLDNLERLHKAARKGNVSAIRALAKMMQPEQREQHESDDAWLDVVPPASVTSEKSDLH